MGTIPPLNEEDLELLVRYSIDRDETVSEAIVRAFLAVDIDVFDRDTTLQEWVNVDALEEFAWSSEWPLYVSTRVWSHQIVITTDDVRIYSDAPRRESEVPVLR